MVFVRRLLAIVLGPLIVSSVMADSVELPAVRDNTLFAPDGEKSNGEGPAFFAGRVGAAGGGFARRAVLAFDLEAALPSNVVITHVTLRLTAIQGGGPDVLQPVTVHRLLDDWGEGTSSAGGGSGAPATPDDATWLHRFFPDQFWSTPGGDFDPEIHTATDVGIDPATVEFPSTPALVADVQHWLDHPEENHGWILVGNETQTSTVRKFASREADDPLTRPVLMIEYDLLSSCPGDADGNGVVNVHDLLTVVHSFGPCDDCPADFNEDNKVNVLDLLIVIFHWGPCP